MAKVSLETRKKISKTMKKRWQEKEYRENQIKSTIGRKLTDEHKENISKARQGIELSDKTKYKMSEYQSKRPKEVKDKQVKSSNHGRNSGIV